jgi:hypothetical protein
VRAVALAVTAALLAGCATPGKDVVAAGSVDLAAAPLCCGATLAEAPRKPLPAAAQPLALALDKASPAWSFGGVKAYFVLFELPAYSQPYSFTITSQPSAGIGDLALLIPRVALYDAQWQPTRYFEEKTLRNRGNQLERTVFVNPGNAGERYVAIFGSDLSASIERSYQMVTSTPVFAGPVMFNMVSGHDGKSVLRSSPVGNLTLQVHGLDQPAAAPSR